MINTPRFAFETVAREYEETPSDENLEGGVMISQLALRSLLLPNADVALPQSFNFRGCVRCHKLLPPVRHEFNQGPGDCQARCSENEGVLCLITGKANRGDKD